VDQLTEAQTKEALKASILAQGNEEIARAGEITNNYSDRLAQASTVVTDLKDNIGRALLPAMASLLQVTLDNNETLALTTEEINTLGREVYRVANVLIFFGRSLLQLQKVVKVAWNGIQNTFI